MAEPVAPRFNRRVRIAMIMALVATLGAVTAYSASRNELVATGCERKLDEVRIFELVQRQGYLDRLAAYQRLEDRFSQNLRLGDALTSRADSARRGLIAADPAALDLAAQVDFAVARELRPIRDFIDPGLSADLDLESGLSQKAESDARRLGISNRCGAAAQKTSSRARVSSAMKFEDYFQPLEGEIASIRGRSVNGALAVAIFVLALGFFTLSEIFRNRVQIVLEVIAYAIGAFAIWYAIRSEPSTWLSFVLATLAFVAVGAAAWAVIRRMHVAEASAEDAQAHVEFREFDTEGFVGKHVHFKNVRDRFDALGVSLIALAALLSALSAWGYSFANNRSSNAAALALSDEMTMLRESTRRETSTSYVIERMINLFEARLRETAANTFARYAREGSIPRQDAAYWAEDAAHWAAIRSASLGNETDTETRLLEGSLGPYQDPNFPERLFYGDTISPVATQLALWDAQDEQGAAWASKASSFLASLTMFAIALYLFGQALGMGRGPGAYVLFFFGSVLLAFGLVLGFSVVVSAHRISNVQSGVSLPAACGSAAESSAPQSIAAAAAACFAHAQESYWLARSSSEYETAAAAYQAAADLRPSFAFAQYLAIGAQSLGATTELQGRYSSVKAMPVLSNIDERYRKLIDESAARDLDSDAFLPGYAFNEFQLALAAGDKRRLTDAIAQTRRAIDSHPDELYLRYNLAVALLASNDAKDAQAAYDLATADQRNADDPDVPAGAIGDLELVRARCTSLPWLGATRCDELQTTINGFESSIVTAAWPSGAGSPPGDLAIDDKSIFISPKGIGWTAHFSGADASTGPLVMLAYRYDDKWNSRFVLPYVSYLVSKNGANFERRSDGVSDFRSYLSGSDYSECLALSGRYHIEFYRNGRLIAHPPDKDLGKGPHLGGTVFAAAGTALCYPDGNQGWHRIASSDGTLRGGFRSSDGSRGALVASEFWPRFASDSAQSAFEMRAMHQAVDATLRWLGRGSLSSRAYHELPMYCPMFDNWAAPHRIFQSRDLTLLAKTWATNDGLIHIGVVWSPAVDDQVSCSVLTSMVGVDPHG